MKILSIDGIIISDTNYSESSKILNVLTKDLGIIGVMSKGCRNIKNKLRSVSQKMIYGTFHIYYKDEGLSTLISVDIKNSFSNILSDLTKISYAAYILDLVRQVEKEINDENIFIYCIDSLEKMNDGFDPLVLTNIMELKMLDYLGVRPSLDECSVCGDKDNIITISSYLGGLVCKDCVLDDLFIFNPKTIKLIRALYYVEIKKISKLDISYEIKEEINNFIKDYYDRYTGLYLKSRDFINKIEGLK